jgi:pyridoxine kinase
VLSIQSHVVHGYVGNKCATLPIQLHAIEVDPIHTVHFSTHTCERARCTSADAHTDYPHWRGTVLSTAELTDIFDSLRANGLHRQYTHALTGYCRDAELLKGIADFIAELRKTNEHFFYGLLRSPYIRMTSWPSCSVRSGAWRSRTLCE